MSDHSDTVQSLSERDKFHFYCIKDKEWVDTEIEELEEYRSAYRTDNIIFSHEAQDTWSMSDSMYKSAFKRKIRSDSEKMHMGSVEECDLNHE